MHHFPLHIGDFSKDTAPFTPEEVGIYLRLLMLYYSSQEPLPADIQDLQFKTMARTRSEKESLSHVLRRCFTLNTQKNAYVQKRCEAVIAEYLKQGVQSRFAILCKHWERVNSGHPKPKFADFAKDPDSYFDKATGHILKVTGRSATVLRLESEDATATLPPKSQPVTGNQEPITNDTPIVPKGTPTMEALAESVYALYPRKVGKGAAIKAIVKVLKKGDITELALQNSVRAYATAVAEWPEQDKTFIPNPSTWFNQMRYMDDPATWKREEPPASHLNSGAQKNRGGRPAPDITAADLEMDLVTEDEEPTGWLGAWAELYDSEPPDMWADVPPAIQERILVYIEAQREKNKGGAN